MVIEQWVGEPGATEHRTTGGRAWCFQDQTWCYPAAPCTCCMEASPDYRVCPTCDGEGHILKGQR